MDVERRRRFFSRLLFAIIVQTGVLNALLATLASAAAVAMISGAWIELRSITVGSGAAPRSETSWHLIPWELPKAIPWLMPFTAFYCAWFGLLAGFIGGAFMWLRGPHVASRRFRIETSALGLLLACVFPPLDAWIHGSPFYPLALYEL